MDAAALGGAVIAVLTQLVSVAADRVGVILPPFAKQLLALAIASGFISFAGLHPFTGIAFFGVDVTGILNTLTAWAAALFAHDLAGTVAPKHT